MEKVNSSNQITEPTPKKGENLSRFPRYGWKVSLDHKFPEKRDQRIYPRINQLFELLPLFFRYTVFYFHTILRGRKPFIDCMSMVHGKQMYGVPLGGIGCGTIGRGFKGEFCRYQMVPGIYEYHTVMANQFLVTVRDTRGNALYQKVLSPNSKSKKGLKSWEWGFSGTDGLYCGLYPRSWTVYNLKETSIRLICRQISPVIPDNYKDSSMPVGVFVWTVENGNPEPREVSITLSFKNGTGSSDDKFGECWTQGSSDNLEETGGGIKSVSMHQTLRGMNLCYCVAVKTTENVSGSYCLGFDPHGSGEQIWNDLKRSGELSAEGTSLPKTRRGEERAIAACGKISLAPNESGTIDIALSWDMPQIVFKSQSKTYSRRYARWFKNQDTAAKEIASYALTRYPIWEDLIEEWQDPVLKDPDIPDWFKSAIFNELYFVSDGGSVWVDLAESSVSLPSHDPRTEYGHFAYLESHEYRMYNTYDVHFYASWALIMLWPQLQKCIQFDMAEATISVDLADRIYLFKGERGPRKIANAVPHDVGDPEDEPFVKVNAYKIHDTNHWKDLNLKFVLQVFRDFAFMEDKQYLSHMWPVCRAVMDRSFSHVSECGLIANNGTADQTYDSWVMHGPSAYCSSLWVASLAVMVEMSSILEDKAEETKFSEALEKAKKSLYTKLWNGEYFNFDSCNRNHSKSIMADQLVGHWYLSLSGLKTEVFTKESVKSVLKLLFEKNVMSFKNGEMGAVNGMNPNGSIDYYTMQSEEMWVGVSYGLAALMISEGMVKEGFKTAEGIYKTVYEKIGQGFETPEALYAEKKYRAVGYMRPLAIWSMLRAYQINKKNHIKEPQINQEHQQLSR